MCCVWGCCSLVRYTCTKREATAAAAAGLWCRKKNHAEKIIVATDADAATTAHLYSNHYHTLGSLYSMLHLNIYVNRSVWAALMATEPRTVNVSTCNDATREAFEVVPKMVT